MIKIKSFNTTLINIITVIVIVSSCIRLIPLFAGRMQQDFSTYYFATKAVQQGLNPYNIKSLQLISGNNTICLPFVYPPYFLSVFKIFTTLDYRSAYNFFLFIKLTAFACLVMIWMRIVPVFLNELWPFIITVLVGYRCTVLKDLIAGNVSIFEQLFLWSGILMLLRMKTIIGGLSILFSSFFKMVLFVFLPIIIFIQRSWRSFYIALSLFASGILFYIALYTNQRDLWRFFFNTVIKLDERGIICPSLLAFLRDTAEYTGISNSAVYVSYTFLCCIILSICIWAFLKTGKSKDIYPMIYIALIAYSLVAPRMKDYSLIIVLLPALHTISAMGHKRWIGFVGCILMWVPLFEYQALVLSSFVFILLLFWIWKAQSIPDRKMELTLNPLRGFRNLY